MNSEKFSISENKATETSRNKRSYRWAIEMILEKSFGLASVFYGDIDPDRKDNFLMEFTPYFIPKNRQNQ